MGFVRASCLGPDGKRGGFHGSSGYFSLQPSLRYIAAWMKRVDSDWLRQGFPPFFEPSKAVSYQ